MKVEDIRKVLIVGSGNMGQQIGFQCAISGYDVTLYDISETALEKAKKRIQKLADGFVAAGKLTLEKSQADLKRIHITTDDVNAAKEADFISESVPEDPKLKGEIFSRFNTLCPSRTVFTTNTSTLIPSMMAQDSGRPDKFAAFHFHDIRITQIVDIMPHPGTSRETLEIIEAFAIKIGQIPIMMKKESNGYVFNAMLMDLFKSAQKLAARNVATVEDIDRAWMGMMHTFAGPFGIMDSIGLDTVWKITDYWATKLGDPQMLDNASFMKQYVDKGYLGVKSGRGFYTYPDPAFARPGFIEGKPI